MNSIDNSSKVFLIPDGVNEFEFVVIRFETSHLTLAVSGEDIFELTEVGPGSQYDKRPEPKLPSGDPVKSLIIESLDDSQGSVLSSPSFISFTQFDMTYPVIKWMSSQSDLYAARYHTVHDISDGFSSCLQNPHQIQLIMPSIISSLGLICEQIEENEEFFYKLSHTKLHSFLNKKIQRLSDVLSKNPDYALSNLIKETLTSVSGNVPPEVLKLQTTIYSVNFLFGSYLNSELMKSFLDYIKLDLTPLQAYLAERESEEKARTVAEENIGMGNTKVPGKGSISTQKLAKNSMSKKKPVKKVAVGKGALDSFFKKQ